MNNNYCYEYSVLGYHIFLKTPFDIKILDESKAFLHPLEEGAKAMIEGTCYDWSVMVEPVLELPEPEDGDYYKEENYYGIRNSEIISFRCKNIRKDIYACTMWDSCMRQTRIQYVKKEEERLVLSRMLLDLIGAETLFLHMNALMLHASFISFNDSAILFSAPSGTGKSTQADLWAKYEVAEIVNGDRAGIRLENKKWTAYGLPYAGSSGIYKNKSFPIRAIVVLKQGPVNEIRKLNSLEAFRYLYPQAFIHHWDSRFVSVISSMLLELASDIPIYELSCLPDKGAVELLKETIEQSR